MNEPKPFASLGPTLLARKGGAKPAMRPQIAPIGMGNMGGAQAARALDEDFDALEDLGWNDMGEDDAPADRSAEVLQLTPAPHNAEAEAETDAGSPKALVQAETKAEAKAEAKTEAKVEAKVDTGSRKPHVVEAEAESDAPKPRVRSIHEELAEMLEKGETAPVAKVKPAKPAKPALVEASAAIVEIVEDKSSRRAAFTLRLDAKRHLKLRLASTVRNRSAQQLVTEALDRFLRDIPEVELLARNIQHNGRKGG